MRHCMGSSRLGKEKRQPPRTNGACKTSFAFPRIFGSESRGRASTETEFTV